MDMVKKNSLPEQLAHTDTHTQPSFSWKNRLRRGLWNIVYLLFFVPSPRCCHFWRAWLLRCFGAQLGKGCHIYPNVQIWDPRHLICHDYVGVGDRVILYNIANIELHNRVVISQGSHICTGTHDYEDMHFPVIAHPITIQQEAWIGAESFLLPGIIIGEGAVIGARSLVTHNMPAWMVCVGHPCRPIKSRCFKRSP